MAATLKKKEDRRAYDRYETPKWAVDALFKLVPIRNEWKYLEPCRATGRIYNELPLGSAWAEIQEGVDYLSTPYHGIDCIVTNPPFSLAKEFVEKSLKEAPVVIMLLRIGFLGSMKRKEFLTENPPTSMIVFSKRPSFTDDGKTDGAEYAYFVWDKEDRLGLQPFSFIGDK
ncbi:hypothetical protein [Burkholderia pseudomallei]|uniref:hypothetical protein n=1 Tax=Burkholderia pseudomallei TaxID=28450 RepID=UPI00106018FD|nr:hypothetical protein [Burkholderia pseudomallei]